MRSVRSQRRVLDLVDARAAAAFGGLEYANQAVDTAGEPTSVSLVIGSVSSFDSETQHAVVPLDRTALDRRGVVVWPRPEAAPDRAVPLSEVLPTRGRLRSWPTTETGLEAWRRILGAFARVRQVDLDGSGELDEISSAQVVLHLVASGVLVRGVDRAHPALQFLDPGLVAEIVDPGGPATDDPLEWAAAVTRQMRRAWLGHDLELTWSPDEGRVGTEPRRTPTVSVILVSRRPELIDAALRRVAAQVGIDAEVVVGLHHQSAGAVDAAASSLSSLGLTGQVLRIVPAVPFGAALNLTVQRSSGQVITKWDDDDLYGPHHLEDLVVAMRRSGADMVGKAAEFIHFADSGETAHRGFGGAGSDSTFIAGGTLTMSRHVFDSVGGFPPTPRFVDHHLKQRFLKAGLRVYRTHGFGFALVRGRDDHTWGVSTEDLRKTADRTFVGFPTIIDLGDDL